MAHIFSRSAGTAAVLTDPTVVPMIIGPSGWIGGSGSNAVLQGVSVSSEGNYQFLNTLRNYTYVYVFGEKMGDIVFTGVGFTNSCSGGLGDGMSNVIAYYAANGIYWTGAPIGIVVGAAAFAGFLVRIETTFHDPERQMSQFRLFFKTLPPG